MDEAIGVLGQTILVLVALALVVVIVFFVLVVVRAIIRVIRELRPRSSILPPTDAYIPQSFDRSRPN